MPAPRSHKNIGGQSAGATRHFLVFLEVLKHGFIKVYEVFFFERKNMSLRHLRVYTITYVYP